MEDLGNGHRRFGYRSSAFAIANRVEAHHLHGLAEGGDPDGPGVPLCARYHARVENATRAQRE